MIIYIPVSKDADVLLKKRTHCTDDDDDDDEDDDEEEEEKYKIEIKYERSKGIMTKTVKGDEYWFTLKDI